MKKKLPIWHLVCLIAALAVYSIVVWMWKDYLQADVKFKAEARLSLVETHVRYEYDDSDKDTFSDKYKEVYDYKLTWRFEDPKAGQTRSYYTETYSSTDHAYKEGQTKTIFVYYNRGDADFEVNDAGDSILVILGGTVILLLPFLDALSRRRKARKIAKFQKKAAAAAMKNKKKA